MIVLTGGGTGGHIFPLISVVEELKKRGIDSIAWVGGKGGEEEKWAKDLGIIFFGIRTGKLRRYLSVRNFLDVINVISGILSSYFILRKLKPGVLFSKGGFVSVPPAVAARFLRIPVLTHESDLSPGLATRIISRFADIVFTSFEETGKYLKTEKLLFSGNPVRRLIKEADPERGKSFLRFKNDLPVVTVIGGSLGAERINRVVWSMVETRKLEFNLVHQCGAGKIRNIRIDLPNYRMFEFLKERVGDVLACSDIIVSRAGAGALYEIGYLGKPSILIPLSKGASRGEQILNAKYFSNMGASIIIDEKQMTPEFLYNKINNILARKGKLEEMGRNARALIKPDGEILIADYIMSYYNNRR